MSENILIIEGHCHTFFTPALEEGHDPHGQCYALMAVPFGDLRRISKPYEYSEGTGKGEQRCQTESHVRNIHKAMHANEYAPTTISLALYERHSKLIDMKTDGSFSLPIDCSKRDAQLPIVDGGHRMAAAERVRDAILAKLKKADDAEKEELQYKLDAFDAVPVPVMLYIDGLTSKKLFVALQLGRNVDRTHMIALSLQKGSDPNLLAARAIAMELNKMDGSPFKGLLRFSDSQQAKKDTAVRKIAFNSLCATGASDLSFSLVGLAKVGLSFGLDVPAMTKLVLVVNKALNVDDEYLEDERYQDMTSDDMVLCGLDAGGTIGGATIYLGIATCLAYRLGKQGRSEPERQDVEDLIEAALATVSSRVGGGMDGARKRTLMGKFVRKFLVGEANEVQGVPYKLLELIGSSAAYDVDKDEWKKARKKAEAEASEQTEGEES